MSIEIEKIRELTRQGVCLIPVDESTKRPFGKWSNASILGDGELIDLMDKHQTEAVAMVLGEKSGGMVCIDIDSKYKEGFSSIFFLDMKNLYPDLLKKMIIEKTPSGGRHLFYRVKLDGSVNEYPRSAKLASRWATEDELVAGVDKTLCFLEIKCEGGLSQCYPSPRYVITQDPGICELSWEEHCAIYNLCVGYNEVFKVEKNIGRAVEKFIDIYDEDPFTHFDRSEDAEGVLEKAGWGKVKDTGKHVYYSRPGIKGNWVSASFNRENRLYTIFTTSSEATPNNYRPSILLRELWHGGDGKKCYNDLVNNGFGRIKVEVEERLLQNAAKYGSELPKNISGEVAGRLEEEREKVFGIYPHGIFWERRDDGGYDVSRLMVYSVSAGLGFRVSGNLLVKIEGFFISRVEEREYFDALRDYIDKAESDYSDIFNAVDLFLQKSGKFCCTQLEKLDAASVLRSSRDVGYKGYKNGYVEVTGGGILLRDWGTLEKLFWKHQIQDRDFIEGEVCGLYYDFLSKAIGISDHLMKCIGYYAHEYKSTMTSYIVILCEMTDDPRNGGGSGKNIFTNLLQFTTSLLNKPGRNATFDDTLLRTWKGQKVLSLNDVDKRFDYLGLRELSSGEGEVGKKYVQEEVIENAEMPKFMVNTNYSFDASGPGLKRRLVPLEFTSFFIDEGGVDVHYGGKVFPSDKTSPHDWGLEDWIGYDNFIMKCIQKFIQAKCKLTVPLLTNGGWKKQFEEKYSSLILLFIEENIASWLDSEDGKGFVDIINVFNPSYEKFCNENNIDKRFRLSSKKMNEALQDYCERHGILFDAHKNRRNHAGIQSNVKLFRKNPEGVVREERVLEDIEEGREGEEIEGEEEFTLF